jgi:hypothetical protein
MTVAPSNVCSARRLHDPEARRDARHRLSLLQTDVVIGAIRLMMFRPPPVQPLVKLGMDGEAATLS